MDLTEGERMVLDMKIEDPHKNLKCPRCGCTIEYHKYKTALRVNCPTPGCIQLNLRGI